MKKAIGVGFTILLLSVSALATPIDQYATSVLGFSSQYEACPFPWSSCQALGPSDTAVYGDIGTSWAPAPRNGTLEYLTLGFLTNVYSDGVTIRETYGNGFVYQVDVLDMSSMLHTVFAGVDPSLPGSPVDYLVSWSRTPYLVQGVKIYVDTDHNLSTWEEIDSVQLHGDTTPGVTVPEPSLLSLFAASMAGLLVWLRSARCQP
jgi:hypothetical protein